MTAEIVTRFVLLNLRERHGSQWLSSPRRKRCGTSDDLCVTLDQLGFELKPRLRQRLLGLKSVRELWQHYYFRGIALDSHEGMVGWIENRYPLILRLDIPTPDEMLEVQCQGRRYISFLHRPEQQLQRYGRHENACAFLLHDFEHAHKFFSDTFRGQVGFFMALRESSFATWSEDPLFCKDLDYLKSDMNSHPVHLTKYLKAIVLTAEIRRTGSRTPDLQDFWQHLFDQWKMPPHVLRAALTLNHPEIENIPAQRLVSEFFTADVGYQVDNPARETQI